MKYKQAKQQLQHALKHQKTISIPKLNKLLQSMNISLKPSKDKEVKYLKNEIQKLRKQLKKQIGGMNNESERIDNKNRTMGD